MNIIPTTALAVGITLSLTSMASAQGAGRGGPALNDIAAELGVSEDALKTCMPRPEGRPAQRPTQAEHEARITEIASCLSVSVDAFDAVMQEHRPMPRQGG